VKLKAFSIWLVWFGILFLVSFIFTPLLFSIYRNEPLQNAIYLSDLPGDVVVCAILAAVGTLILWAMPIRRPLWAILFGALFSTALVLLVGGIWFLLFPNVVFAPDVDHLGFIILLPIPNGLAGACASYLRNRVS